MNRTSHPEGATLHSVEANFDGLVGPTHAYGGLSFGNLASTQNKAQVANPREAALQGLRKMRTLSSLGLIQGVLPPHERPALEVLRRIGFSGSDKRVLADSFAKAPALLAAAASASPMWAANAATISPSADSGDGKVHLTPANLVTKFHRSYESTTTSRILKAIFRDPEFVHHEALPSTPSFGDEGAANHVRLCNRARTSGLQIFVYGRNAFGLDLAPKKFPARQTLEASQAVARLHQLDPERVLFIQQNPDVIDVGAFHNDVVSVGNANVLLYHEMAFVNEEQTISRIRSKFEATAQESFFPIRVSEAALPITDAVRSYLFNSQLISMPNGKMSLIAPSDCEQVESSRVFLEDLVNRGQTPIREVLFFDLRQSMQNGGGPACLRLRVELTPLELSKVHPHVLLNDTLFDKLHAWIEKHYRDRLALSDLADPSLLIANRTALDELTGLLQLGSIYPFQTT